MRSPASRHADRQPADPARPLADARNRALDNLELLLSAHYSDVWALCYRLTDSRDAADDLAQETFLRVLRYRDTFRGESAFATWLYRLTRNVCADYFKSSRREDTLARALSLDGYSTGDQAVANAGDDRPARLRHAMGLLAPPDREILVLTRYHGLRYTELAQVLDTTPGAARARAHRALKALRDRYLELERRDHEL